MNRQKSFYSTVMLVVCVIVISVVEKLEGVKCYDYVETPNCCNGLGVCAGGSYVTACLNDGKDCFMDGRWHAYSCGSCGRTCTWIAQYSDENCTEYVCTTSKGDSHGCIGWKCQW